MINDYPNIPPGWEDEDVCLSCKKPFKKHCLAFTVVICNACKSTGTTGSHKQIVRKDKRNGKDEDDEGPKR